MREHAIIEHFNFYKLSAGPQLTALRHCLEAAREMPGAERLAAYIEDAIAEGEALFDQEMRWRARGSAKVRHGEKAVALDRRIDRILGGIVAALSSQERLAAEGSERARLARRMSEDLFPGGLAAVSQRDFASQSSAVARLIKRVDAVPEYRTLAGEASFAEGLEALRGMNEEFRREVAAHRPMSFERLQGQRRANEERLGCVVARILGLFPNESPEDRAARARLMEPILAQNALARERRRRHGRKKAVEEKDESAVVEEEDIDASDGPVLSSPQDDRRRSGHRRPQADREHRRALPEDDGGGDRAGDDHRRAGRDRGGLPGRSRRPLGASDHRRLPRGDLYQRGRGSGPRHPRGPGDPGGGARQHRRLRRPRWLLRRHRRNL